MTKASPSTVPNRTLDSAIIVTVNAVNRDWVTQSVEIVSLPKCKEYIYEEQATLVTALLGTSLCRIKYISCRPFLAAALLWLRPSSGYGPLMAAALLWLPPSCGYGPLVATAL